MTQRSENARSRASPRRWVVRGRSFRKTATAIVPFVRPPSPGVILWAPIGVLPAIPLIEILQRTPVEESAVAEVDAR